MNDTEQEIFGLEEPFGTLLVDEDIYYRIVKDENRRPFSKYKAIGGVHCSHGRVRCNISSRKSYMLSRLLMGPKEDELVDHRNRNPLDNRRFNLRIASPRQNSLNKISKNNTGLIGVSFTIDGVKKRLRTAFRMASGRRLTFYICDSSDNRIICALVHDKFVFEAGDDEYAPLNWPILREEPFRGRLGEMDISEFRGNSLESIAVRLGISGLCR